MRKGIQIAAFIIIMATILSFCCICASAEESGTCGEALVWSLSDDGVLTISGTGNMDDWYSGSPGWYKYRNDIQEVVICEGVTSIGDKAFSTYYSFSSMTIASTVRDFGTGCIDRMDDATYYGYTYSLAEYYVKQKGYTFKSIGVMADCVVYSGRFCEMDYTITSRGVLTISGNGDIDEEWTTYSSYIKKVVLGVGVRSIRTAFLADTPNVTEITIPYTTVYINGFHTELPASLTIRGYKNSDAEAFAKKYNKTFVNIGTIPFYTMAEGQSEGISWKLTSDGKLVINGTGTLTTEMTDDIGPYALKVKTVIIGEGISGIDYWVIGYFFNETLEEIYLPSTIREIDYNWIDRDLAPKLYCYKYSAIGDQCENKTSYHNYTYEFVGEAPVWLLEEGAYLDKFTWSVDNHRNLVVEGEGELPALEDFDDPVWQEYLDNVRTITLGKDITLIGDGNFEKVWVTGNSGSYWRTLGDLEKVYGYKNTIAEKMAEGLGIEFVSLGIVEERSVILEGQLTDTISYTIDNYGTLTVSGEGAIPDYEIGTQPWGAQYYDYSPVRDIIISDNITYIGENFCSSLCKSVTIGKDVKEIGMRAFYGCGKLESVRLPEGLEYIAESLFEGCVALRNIYIPESVVMIKKSAFNRCTKLSVEGYENTVASRLCEKAGFEFISCGKRQESYSMQGNLSDTVLWKLESNGTLTISGEGAVLGYTELEYSKRALWYNEYGVNVTELIIGEGITTIGSYAFTYTNIVSLNLPDSVATIGKGAFGANADLKWVWLSEAMESIPTYAFYESGVKYVYIPESVKVININAFYLTELEEVYYGGNSAYWTTSVEGTDRILGASVSFDSNLNGVVGAAYDSESLTLEVNAELSDNEKAYAATYKDNTLTKLVSISETGEYTFEADCDRVKVFIWSTDKTYEPLCDVYERSF